MSILCLKRNQFNISWVGWLYTQILSEHDNAYIFSTCIRESERGDIGYEIYCKLERESREYPRVSLFEKIKRCTKFNHRHKYNVFIKGNNLPSC